MLKALTLRMFPDQMTTLRRLDLAQAAGFDGVEVNLEPWQEYSLATPERDLAHLRAEIETRGLRVSTVYDREQWHYPMSSANPAVRERCQIIVERLAQAAVTLGADAVLVMPGATDNSALAPQPEMVPYALAFENSLSVLRRLAHTAGEKYGVHLALENCPGKFLVSPLEFARFIDAVESPWVGACFDTGTAQWYGFPEHWIPVLGGRITRVHLKDNRLLGSGAVVSTPLLAGDVNWPAVREALTALRYDAWVTAEVFPPYRHHPERLIQDTSAAIDAIFGLSSGKEKDNG
jgi:L-ribulose-5-phosphate 3-epimerase